MRGFLMRKIAGICLIFCLYLTSMSQNTAQRYGYAREYPLIKAFKAVIFYGRQSDWSMVIAELNSINDRIVEIFIKYLTLTSSLELTMLFSKNIFKYWQIKWPTLYFLPSVGNMNLL